jgi:hypothetical protein
MQQSTACLVALLFVPFLPMALVAEPIRVSGRALSYETGKGLAGARVELYPAFEGYAEAVRRLTEKTDPAPLASARTGEEGSFELAAPEGGCYNVVVRAEGFMPMMYSLIPLVEEAELPSTPLLEADPLEIRVLGAGGRPAPGIEIRGISPSVPNGMPDFLPGTWRPADWKGVSGPDGKLVLPRFAGEPLRLIGMASELLTRAGVEVTPESTGPAVFRVFPQAATTIEVRGRDGEPVAAAVVRWKSWPVGRTGPDGRLAVAVPKEGLTVESREGGSARIEASALAGDRKITVVPLVPPRTVAGTVLDAVSRKPVPGAVVWSGEPLVAPPLLTGPDGGFRLEIPGFLDGAPVRTAAGGYLPGERRFLRAKETGPVVLALAPAASLFGIVVDAEGRPVSDARIEPRPSPPRSFPERSFETVTVRSRADGRFRLTGLVPRSVYELEIVKEGLARAVTTARTVPGAPSQEIRIVLGPGRTASGQVLDEKGEPVAGAELTLTGDRWHQAVSDAAGRFELRGLDPGTYELVARRAGFALVHIPFLEIPEDRAAVDLGTVTLPAGVGIAGRVTDARGAPLQDVVVAVEPATTTLPFRVLHPERTPSPFQATTGPDGKFLVGDLRSGERYDLFTHHLEYLQGRLPGVEAPTSDLRIELQKARSLSGRVVGPEGKPVPGAHLSYVEEVRTRSGRSSSGSSSSEFRGRSDAEGFFRIGSLKPGSADLIVSAEGYRTKRIQGIPIPDRGEAESLEIRLERSAILEVTVLDETGEPVAGADVMVRPDEPWEENDELLMDSPEEMQLVRTDAWGRSRIEIMGPGKYELTVQLRSRSASSRLSAGPGVTPVQVQLARGLQVSGRVTDREGFGIPLANVTLEPAPHKYGPHQVVTSDADGSFVFMGVESGSFRLSARKQGYSGSAVPLEVAVVDRPVEGLHLELIEGGGEGIVLTGRLLGLAPEDLVHTRVEAFNVQGFRRRAQGRILPDGTYRIETLEPGDWRVSAASQKGHQAYASIQLDSGRGETVLDLEFTGFTLSGRVLADGKPLVGAEVHALPSRPETGYRANSSTDHLGSFTLRSLGRGTYILQVGPIEGIGGFREIEITADQSLTVEIQTARLSGRVLSESTRLPVDEATIFLDALSSGGDQAFSAPSARSGGDGTFQSSRLAAGTYRLTVRKEGFAPAEATVQLRPGEEATVEVVLKSQDAP